jgi:hypothetical protein
MKAENKTVIALVYAVTVLLAILVVGFDLFVWRP